MNYAPKGSRSRHFWQGKSYLGDDGIQYHVTREFSDNSFQAMKSGNTEILAFQQDGSSHDTNTRLTLTECDRDGNPISDSEQRDVLDVTDYNQSFAVVATAMAINFAGLSAFNEYELEEYGINRDFFVQKIAKSFAEYLNSDLVPKDKTQAVIDYLNGCGQKLEEMRESVPSNKK